ncbi:hypothetical protein FNX44_010660, partial [Streptomyces sp. OF1]|nr:hypothetical protein [Streptomyces alkaliterrae]
MNFENHAPGLPWVPLHGYQLRLAGIYFDAVRVGGEYGRNAAVQLGRLTGGEPGPIIFERELDGGGERAVTYFLVPPQSTGRRRWPAG